MTKYKIEEIEAIKIKLHRLVEQIRRLPSCSDEVIILTQKQLKLKRELLSIEESAE